MPFKHLMLFIYILTKPVIISERDVNDLVIFWNAGYSNWTSFITARECTHFDPGGSIILLPPRILNLCHQKRNLVFFMHFDRFHKKYLSLLSRNFKDLEINAPIRNKTHLRKGKIELISHLKKEDFLQLKISKSSRAVILPNHGSALYLNQRNLSLFIKIPMLITGTQSTSPQNHKRTKAKFSKAKKPILYKNVWGHLILGKNKNL